MSSPWKVNYSRYKRIFLNSVSQYKKRRELKNYLELFLSLITIVVFAVFALRPTLLTIARLSKEIESKEETMAKMDNKIQNLTKAREIYEQEAENIQLLDDSIPKNPLPETLVRQVQGVSNENNVGIASMSLGKVTLLNKMGTADNTGKAPSFPENAKAISFNISSLGNYPSFVKLLVALEKLRRPIKIDSVRFEISQTKDGRALVLHASGKSPYFAPEIKK